MNMVRNALDTAFSTALLLGGSSKMAEAAVFDAIESSEDVSQSSLLVETAKSLVRRRKNSACRLDVCALLPFELGRLFLLDPMWRDSFVLRIWWDCLRRSVREFSRSLCLNSRKRSFERCKNSRTSKRARTRTR